MNPDFRITPSFIDGSAGKLFALHYAPPDITNQSECFVVAASLAEEMNRCRYMGTMLAQQLSVRGYGYLAVDTYGAGDSAGDTRDVRWSQICQDLKTAIDYAHHLGYQYVSLLGIRLGAMHVIQVAANSPNIKRLIFWQPIINGQAALTQFLRIKIAASIGRNEEPGTIKDFEAQIARGEYLNVTGYDIHPEFFNGIKTAHFKNHIESCSMPVGWFTTLTSADRKTPQGDIKLIQAWREKGCDVRHIEVIGPSYWQAHERTLVPELIEETVKHVTETS